MPVLICDEDSNDAKIMVRLLAVQYVCIEGKKGWVYIVSCTVLGIKDIEFF